MKNDFKKAIKLLEKIDENNFIKLFIVISRPSKGKFVIESIPFIEEWEAQQMANYLNIKKNTNKYRVFETAAYCG